MCKGLTTLSQQLSYLTQSSVKRRWEPLPLDAVVNLKVSIPIYLSLSLLLHGKPEDDETFFKFNFFQLHIIFFQYEIKLLGFFIKSSHLIKAFATIYKTPKFSWPRVYQRSHFHCKMSFTTVIPLIKFRGTFKLYTKTIRDGNFKGVMNFLKQKNIFLLITRLLYFADKDWHL